MSSPVFVGSRKQSADLGGHLLWQNLSSHAAVSTSFSTEFGSLWGFGEGAAVLQIPSFNMNCSCPSCPSYFRVRFLDFVCVVRVSSVRASANIAP